MGVIYINILADFQGTAFLQKVIGLLTQVVEEIFLIKADILLPNSQNSTLGFIYPIHILLSYFCTNTLILSSRERYLHFQSVFLF